MFTGIIEETGTVRAFHNRGDAYRLELDAPRIAPRVRLGDSVAVNGCCLTVVATSGPLLAFDLLRETVRLTNLRSLSSGDRVNLEPSLPAGSPLGGHFVSGHIDGTARIERLEARGADTYLQVRLPEDLSRHVVHKGSLALDGISLTVAEVAGPLCAVWLIPHTLAVTNLHEKSVGDFLNVETDLLAKYVEKLLAHRSIPDPVLI